MLARYNPHYPFVVQGMESGLEKIQTLEDSMIRNKEIKTTEITRQAPVFTSPLSNIDSLREGENAHFEARLTPVDDPRLTVSTNRHEKSIIISSTQITIRNDVGHLLPLGRMVLEWKTLENWFTI